MKYVKFKYMDNTYWGTLNTTDQTIQTSLTELKNVDDFQIIINLHNDANVSFNLSDELKLDEVSLLAPVLPTKNIMCIGKNYFIGVPTGTADDKHNKKNIPHPVYFSKAISSIIGHEEQICLHANLTNKLDYEAELAIVIGKKCKDVTYEDALDYVFGMTCLNDITARDLKDKYQWYLGKSLDSFCPIGPYLVTIDEFDNPNNLEIKSYVNGNLRQKARTSQMIHNISDLIVSFSSGCTLNPGDVISTGTPFGVGNDFKSPIFLKEDDVIEVVIEGIGTLRNRVKS